MNSRKVSRWVSVFTPFTLLLAGCGSGQLFGPTTTPTPANTPSPINTPTPALLTPGIFAIEDVDAFPVYDVEGCGGFVVISGIEDGALHVDEAEIEGMPDAAFDKMWEYYWCNGIKHTWLGELTYNGYIISSDSDDPLVFSPSLGKGYLHIGRSGTVTKPDGTHVELTE